LPITHHKSVLDSSSSGVLVWIDLSLYFFLTSHFQSNFGDTIQAVE